MIWMLAAALAICGTTVFTSCTSDNDDNPAAGPDEPQQQLADYTIIFYGHGGATLDADLLRNIMQFYQADTESRQGVSICAQYKFSTLEHLQDSYEDYKKEIDPSNPEEVAFLEGIKALYPYAGKTTRFVVDKEATVDDMYAAIADNFIGPDNADISRADSLTNFINWAAQTCPARKYVLILADHGHGYMPHEELPANDAAAAPQTRGVVFDDGHNKSHFTAKTLSQALSQASVRPSVVYCDACLMNAAEYHFELAPLTDYFMLSTFLVPGVGGNYTELVNILSDNPDNLEQALIRYTKTNVAAWDKVSESVSEDEPYYYYDMNVYRTVGIDAFGAELKKFTDLLIDTYQNGGDEVRAKIDEITANAYRIDVEQPTFDLMNYLFNLTAALPNVFTPVYFPLADQYYNQYFVIQQSSKWLEENGHTVSLSVVLACQGHYIAKEHDEYNLYDADGLAYLLKDGEPTGQGFPWGSTLDATYGQLRFDQITGWSRWLRLNQQEPNRDAFFEYSDFGSLPWTEG